MKKLDFNTFIQILLLIVTIFIAFQNLLPKDRVDLVGIILFWTFVILIIFYSVILTVDIKLFQKLKKIDILENDLRRLKEFLDYKKVAEDLNIRLKIIESKMNKKGIEFDYLIAAIIAVIVLIVLIFIFRESISAAIKPWFNILKGVEGSGEIGKNIENLG